VHHIALEYGYGRGCGCGYGALLVLTGAGAGAHLGLGWIWIRTRTSDSSVIAAEVLTVVWAEVGAEAEAVARVDTKAILPALKIGKVSPANPLSTACRIDESANSFCRS